MNYPSTRIVDVTDKYHGVTVADPYRWLEDDNAPETTAWVEAQNAVTFDYLKAIPGRDTILDRLTTLWDYEKYSLPSKKGGRYFYSKNDGLQNQNVLYVAESLTATPRVLFDPNILSEDGTIALAGTSTSDDGKLLAYALTDAGTDWVTWRVRNIDTGEDLPDTLTWIKNSGLSWTKDGKGFYYSRYEEPRGDTKVFSAVTNHQKVYFHTLGETQDKDVLVYARPDHPDWFLHASITDDGKYLLLYASQGTERKNRIYYKDLSAPDSEIKPIFENGDALYSIIGNDGATFYVRTDRDAPKGRVIAVDVTRPEEANWKTLIPEAKDTLEGVALFGDSFYCDYLRDAATAFKVFGTDGTPQGEIALPGIGSAGGFTGERTDDETFYSYSSFDRPVVQYRLDLKTGTSSVFRESEVAFDPAQFEVKQVFYTSKDGTKVPMFLCHKKGLTLDGTNPTYLYAYGGFNIPLTPFFSPGVVTWMEMGGVFAQACLRGGGEYGKEWHEGGMKLNRQNVFDDFIAAAEWLIAEKYTSTPKLAIAGGSNGGLLVGACMTQRPDLFGACLPAVGVLDMLRFVKFTVGWAWTSDYGSPENEDEFKKLYSYSPYHNLKSGTSYPATLVLTGDHDDRVVPAHSFKYAAALQAAQAPDGPPTLIRIETRAGHGGGKPTTKILEETADKYAFLLKELDFSLPESF